MYVKQKRVTLNKSRLSELMGTAQKQPRRGSAHSIEESYHPVIVRLWDTF